MPYSGPIGPSLEAGIHLVGRCQRPGIDEDDGVEGRPFLVVRIDPLEVHLDQATGGELAVLHPRLDVDDTRFLQGKNSRPAQRNSCPLTL